jgi:TonB-dependent receptor
MKFTDSLARAATCAVACLLTAGLSAQSVPNTKPATDDIVHLNALTVSSGEWGALQSAAEARRQSVALVDVVNPDDIGVLPDFNVGETLQRLPGIAIDMDEAEARFVTIRGFNAHYNTTTINGSLFAVPDRNGRRVYMDVLPASLASSFEVVKMQTPDLEGHSVGGSINIKGPAAIRKKPFTLKIAGKIGWYSNDEGYDGNGPSGTADLLLTRNIGKTMGIAISANYYKRNSYTPSVEYSATRYTADTANPGKLKEYTDADNAAGAFAIPGERRWYWRHNNRTRKGGSFKWEWRPAAGIDLWALAYYNTATDDESRQTDLLNNWNTSTALSNVSADTNAGTIAAARNQQYLGQFDFERSLYGIQLGGNLRLAADSTLNFRATRSGSRFRNPENWVEWRRGGTRAELAFNYRQDGDLFYFSGTGAAKKPDLYVDNFEEDRVNFGSYNFNRRQFDDRSLDETVHDVQVDFEQRNLGGVKNLSAKAGVKFRRIDRDFDEERNKYNTRGDGKYTLGQAGVVNSSIALRPPGALPYQSIVIIDPTRANASWLAEYAANQTEWDAKFDPMTNDDNNLDYTTVEDVTAAYAMLSYTGGPLTIIGGVRMEDTHDKSTGRVLADGVWGPTQNNGRYRDWLPSGIVAYDLSRHDKLRLGASATLGRPPFNQFAPVGETVNAGTDDDGSYLTVTRSNPDLKPRRSVNISLAYDHYFKNNKGLVGIALHHNRLKDEIFTATSEMDIMWEGELQRATVRQPTNSARATTISAVELILLRHLDFLPGLLSGLKFNGNLTLISSDFRVLMDKPDAAGNPVWFRTRTAIGQPKRTVNIALLYDWKRLSAKIAVNHTSLKLTERVNTAQAHRSRYEDTATRLTANIGYKFNKHWRVDLSGWNLTDENRREVTGLCQELPMVTAEIGRAVFAGVTYSY